MVNRYRFFDIFRINPESQDIYPLYSTIINGKFYQQYYSIAKGLSFGGIDIYKLVPRDFSAKWDDDSKILTIVGIY